MKTLIPCRVEIIWSFNFSGLGNRNLAPTCALSLFSVLGEMTACLLRSHTLSSQFPLSHFPVLFWTNLHLITLLLQILLVRGT